jgi:hypothetical protein
MIGQWLCANWRTSLMLFSPFEISESTNVATGLPPLLHEALFMPTNFEQIRDMIESRVAFKATYDKNNDGTPDTEELVLSPHVLGYKREPPEPENAGTQRVLCYQTEPDTEWRCFKVNQLQIMEVLTEDEFETPNSYAHSRHQNCVQNVRHRVRVT